MEGCGECVLSVHFFVPYRHLHNLFIISCTSVLVQFFSLHSPVGLSQAEHTDNLTEEELRKDICREPRLEPGTR